MASPTGFALRGVPEAGQRAGRLSDGFLVVVGVLAGCFLYVTSTNQYAIEPFLVMISVQVLAMKLEAVST